MKDWLTFQYWNHFRLTFNHSSPKGDLLGGLSMPLKSRQTVNDGIAVVRELSLEVMGILSIEPSLDPVILPITRTIDLARSSPQWWSDRSTTTHIVLDLFTHLGLWRKLNDYSLHHFTTGQCILKYALLTFSSTSNRLAEIGRASCRERV